MRNQNVLSRRKSFFALTLGLTLLGGLSAPFTPVAQVQAATLPVMAGLLIGAPAAATTVASGAVELSPTPPNDTSAVAPNIMVTFDDSGSMAFDYMGDNRPYDDKGWGNNNSNPWRCAGVIDPRVTKASELQSQAMNGVYYNPNVIYSPPVNADGTSFPNADKTLKGVWNDGVTANRPRNSSNGSQTNFLASTKGWYYNNGWRYGSFPSGSGYWSNNDPSREPRNGEYTYGYYPKAWTCTGDSSNPTSNGGPYYYRLKDKVDIGTIDVPKTGNLYSAGNWEAVAITNTNVTIDDTTVNQYQNWANWWAYYHNRNLMARTSISRVFGALGGKTTDGGFGSSVRVAWQNLNDGTFKLDSTAIISELADTVSCTNGNSADPESIQEPSDKVKPPPCYRSAFFNWIFQTGASGGTPSVDAANRAGRFFQRGATTNKSTLRNPYWQAGKINPDGTQAAGAELYCRQNFHMLVTDGLWNSNDVKLSDLTTSASNTVDLPDGTSFVPSASYNAIFGAKHASSTRASLSDVAFNYWATNLRSDLYKPADGKFVPPYMPDKTTGVVTTSDVSAAGLNNAHVNNELYFNPKNDPANWPHLVQYMVGLGVSGKRTFSNDTDCDTASSDACKLRKGTVSWPQPSDSGNGIAENIDDTWHAAIASRGSYFNAGNPKDLVEQLSAILTNITARNAPAATGAVNTSVLVPGALGFNTGYNSGDWSGTLQAVGVNADGTTSTTALWDAAGILDKASVSARKIFTAKESATDGSFDGGVEFKTDTDLDAAGRILIGTKPPRADPLDTTNDTVQTRINYLRGDTSKESTTFRKRSTLLGAIIGSQPVYVAYPSSGYRNSWPTGSPEQKAIAADAADCADTSVCSSYEYFVKNHLTRTPTVYVGANDGMLHAFNAGSEDVSGVIKPTADAGKELFAYVPRSTYANLGSLTVKDNFKFLPTVDGIPVTRDVFFGAATSTPTTTTAGWHTILVGGLRLGGRGVYALDITDPTAMSADKVLWEFNADAADQGTWTDGTVSNPGGKPSNLGYTFGQPNIGRLKTGKWVVLVPGGYFPDCSKPPYNASNCSYPAAASNKYSSLFVLDAQTGKLIRELKTDPTVVASHGLSSPVLGDYNDDQIDDVAFAGDLDGNLWRYDLSSSAPSSWTVSLAYQPATPGAQPITSMPRLFGDPVTNKFIVVFGTGKYLGASDNTSDSGAKQAVYGIRDLGKTVKFTDLVKQTLSEATADDNSTLARGLTNEKVPASKGGWYFNLAPSTSSAGERVVVTPAALFDTGRVIIQTLIPGTNDPCSATIQGALMVLNAATGGSEGGLTGPSVSGWGGSGDSDTSTVGGRVNNPRTGGSLPVVSSIGGGTAIVPGLKLTGSGDVLNINDAIWRRRSWRALNNDQ